MFMPEAVTHKKINIKNSQPTGNNHSTIHACTTWCTMSSNEMMDIGFKGKTGRCAAQT